MRGLVSRPGITFPAEKECAVFSPGRRIQMAGEETGRAIPRTYYTAGKMKSNRRLYPIIAVRLCSIRYPQRRRVPMGRTLLEVQVPTRRTYFRLQWNDTPRRWPAVYGRFQWGRRQVHRGNTYSDRWSCSLETVTAVKHCNFGAGRWLAATSRYWSGWWRRDWIGET